MTEPNGAASSVAVEQRTSPANLVKFQQIDPEVHVGWEDWPTREEACRILECSPSKLQRLTNNGELVRYLPPNRDTRYYRWDPAQLEAKADELNAVKEQRAAMLNDAKESSMVGMANMLSAMLRHFQEMAKLQQKSWLETQSVAQNVTQLLSSENTAVRERSAKAEATNLELLQSIGDLLKLNQEREIALAEHHGSERRKDAVIGALQSIMPDLKTQLLGTLQQSTAGRGAAAMRLLNGLSAANLEAIRGSGLLNAEQVADLDVALGRLPESSAKTEEPTTAGDAGEKETP